MTRLKTMHFASFAIVLLACGDDDKPLPGDGGTFDGGDSGGPVQDGGVDDGGVCGRTGEPCTDQCAEGYRCIGGSDGKFCVRAGRECGIAACPDETPLCLRPKNSGAPGWCVSQEEKTCACVRSPNALEPSECGKS